MSLFIKLFEKIDSLVPDSKYWHKNMCLRILKYNRVHGNEIGLVSYKSIVKSVNMW